MIQLSLDELRPGMVLAKSIVRETGELLLASGYVINDRILDKMKTIGLSSCWIFEDGTDYVVPEEILTEQLSLQILKNLREDADLLKEIAQLQDLTRQSLSRVLGDAQRFRNIISVKRTTNTVREILVDIMDKAPVVVNLSSMRTKSGYLYQHSLDVTITAIMLATKLKYPFQEIQELAMGCLLMDLGMVILADSLVNKSGNLSWEEKELLKEHAYLGYTILRENENITLTTAHVAYQHHERQDGSGYPRGLRGDNSLPIKSPLVESGRIHRYAEIAAVADAYISLLSPRPGTTPPLPAPEAIRVLIQSAGTHLNKSVVDTLISMVPLYPVGSRIVVVEEKKPGQYLGFSGIVGKSNPGLPERPMIVLLWNMEKLKIKPIQVDLAEHSAIKIQFAKLR